LRQRITVAAVLANRRIEAGKKVVEFSRWITGNGVLSNARIEADGIAPSHRRTARMRPD
jgi:hypothetical protein